MPENGNTTITAKKRTVKRLALFRRHPRETKDDLLNRVTDEALALRIIERKDPELVATARLQSAAA